jgi:DNA recombination protein RmuC
MALTAGVVVLVVGAAVGIALGWLLAASRAARAWAEARELRVQLSDRKQEAEELRVRLGTAENAAAASAAQTAQIQANFVEQKALLSEARGQLGDAFKSLAADALERNNQQFLLLAQENLKAREQAIEGIVDPVRESLKSLDDQIRAIENARCAAYGTLGEQVKSLFETQSQLRVETANLVKALRAPVVRGRWGEIQLRRVVEMAGMVEHCDFFEQETVQTQDGKLRPDLRVQLPGGKNIVVDAKAPLQGYLDSVEAPTEEVRTARLKDHARQVRDHMAKLAAKAYWEHQQPTPEFVVLFLPGESFFSAALEQDPSLIEQGVSQGVILATPTTLIALLRAVAYGWRQERLAENAGRISQLGQELHERLATMAGHMSELGGSLKTSVERYNKAVGSLESRVLTTARRFKELGVPSRTGIAVLEPVDSLPRELASLAMENGVHENVNGK